MGTFPFHIHGVARERADGGLSGDRDRDRFCGVTGGAVVGSKPPAKASRPTAAS